jgi:starch phosphorylase
MNHEQHQTSLAAQSGDDDLKALERAVQAHLNYTCGEDERSAKPVDFYLAIAHVVRDRLMHRWLQTRKANYDQDMKRVYYLSAEFMLGRSLASHLRYVGLYEAAERLFERQRVSLDDILGYEAEPGLGNGGLGRLAACYLDSLASLSLPGYGYGIRYEYGIFEQTFENGWQVEHRDTWLRHGNPWEIPRPQYTVEVPLYGRVEESVDPAGRLQVRWIDCYHMLGTPYDVLVPGYGTPVCNSLRLWSARASRDFNLQLFNSGDFRRAVEDKVVSETVSKVLYPVDDTAAGKELRLKQQFFFTYCSIHDLMRRYKVAHHDGFDSFADKVAIQLNDTHPAVAVAELMRRFVDDEALPWEKAWDICQKTFAFTNHTLMSEALERWPVEMFGRLLPRHLKIIYEINRRLLRDVQIFEPGNTALQRDLSIIEEGPEQRVRMAHLAVVGSHSVNGVAALHSELLKTELFRDFARLWPERFNNKTNGVTPRRFLWVANPLLSRAITQRIGDGWLRDLAELGRLADFASDPALMSELAQAKHANKQRLVGVVKHEAGVELLEDAMYVVQVKRLHEYKRQLLNCLYLISEYQQQRAHEASGPNRVFIFGGKAAPGYRRAKLIIKLINEVADVVNMDHLVNQHLRAVFIPNYDVSLAEVIMPAADLSVQISLAGTEASGTGNMKLMMNGALTIGTRDGANIEIEEAVGADACFSFGLSTPEVAALKRTGYDPSSYIAKSPRLRAAIELIEGGLFAPDEPGIFGELIDDLRHSDPYLVCADFDAYVEAQERAGQRYLDGEGWQRDSLLNIARSGQFSSDRAIRQYADEIWSLAPVRM